MLITDIGVLGVAAAQQWLEANNLDWSAWHRSAADPSLSDRLAAPRLEMRGLGATLVVYVHTETVAAMPHSVAVSLHHIRVHFRHRSTEAGWSLYPLGSRGEVWAKPSFAQVVADFDHHMWWTVAAVIGFPAGRVPPKRSPLPDLVPPIPLPN